MPEKLSITAKIPAGKDKDGKVTPELGPITVSVDTGKTAKEMIEMFSDEAVKTNAVASWVVTLQGNIRSGLKKGEDQKTMQARLGTSKMGISAKGVKVDPKQAWLALFDAGTPEEKAKMIADLKARAANK